MVGKLYIVGTPIGNLSDFSPRAIQTLKEVDFIAAEDTRVTAKLLNHFDIKKPLVSYFEHNKLSKLKDITDRLLKGETCAIVTDAGMPAISDPGEDLVRECICLNIPTESVPGPTAITTALALSGMSTKRFTFDGFLPTENAEREEYLRDLQSEKRTICLYEAPHKLEKTLEDLLLFLGDRKIAVVKEITKIHEQVLSLTLASAVEYFKANEPKGEYVLIIEGATKVDVQEYSLEQAVALAKGLMQEGYSASNAAKTAAVKTKHKKSDIYRLL